MCKKVLSFVLLVTASLSFRASTPSQSKPPAAVRDRIIRAENPDPITEEGDRPALQVVGLSIGNRTVELNSVFSADDNWLTDLKVRVKNISGKRLNCIVVAFGLLAEIDTKLQIHESWPWALGFSRGRCGATGTTDNQPNFHLEPGQETILLHSDIPQIYRRSMDKIGGLTKAVFHRTTLVGFKKNQTIELPLAFPRDAKFVDDDPY